MTADALHAALSDPSSVPRPANLLFWKDVLLAHVRSGQPSLTNRQLAVLMIIYTTADRHTVGGLAWRLDLSSPVVSRSLNMLETLGLLRRSPDPADRRSSLMQRTADGVAFLDHLESAVASSVRH